MKKKYEKPVLITEEFQLDTATAASTCRADATEQKLEYIKLGYNANTCVYDNGQFFSQNNCEVDLAGDDEDGNDTLCYHGPLEGIVFINS